MLRNLLADRFHLKVRLESKKEFPAYELLLAKTGFKLQAQRRLSDAAGPNQQHE